MSLVPNEREGFKGTVARNSAEHPGGGGKTSGPLETQVIQGGQHGLPMTAIKLHKKKWGD